MLYMYYIFIITMYDTDIIKSHPLTVTFTLGDTVSPPPLYHSACDDLVRPHMASHIT